MSESKRPPDPPEDRPDRAPEGDDDAFGLSATTGSVRPGMAAEPSSLTTMPQSGMQEDKLDREMRARGFWGEAWHRFRHRYLAMTALSYVVLLSLVAIFSPAIVGTKPLVCKYKGSYYFPALYYFNSDWENPIFHNEEMVDTVIAAGSIVRYQGQEYEVDYVNRAKDLCELIVPGGPVKEVSLREVELISGGREQTIRFQRQYSTMLKRFDPHSWAVWPLVYQDPERTILAGEWPDQPANPGREEGVPSKYNFFGTTPSGVDVFAIMVHGSRTALLIGFVSMGIAAAIGISIGAAAGYFRGWVDGVLSRAIEVMLCIPTLVLILAMIAVVQNPTIWHTMAVIGLTGWTGIARLTRGEFLKLREYDYVSGAKALGAGPMRIMFLHILRNALAPILVPISFGIAAAILIESGLSFLGYGPPSSPSWGKLLAMGREHLGANFKAWWLILFPGIAIFLTVLAYNLIGEGLQEATDPRLRESGR